MLLNKHDKITVISPPAVAEPTWSISTVSMSPALNDPVSNKEFEATELPVGNINLGEVDQIVNPFLLISIITGVPAGGVLAYPNALTIWPG